MTRPDLAPAPDPTDARLVALTDALAGPAATDLFPARVEVRPYRGQGERTYRRGWVTARVVRAGNECYRADGPDASAARAALARDLADLAADETRALRRDAACHRRDAAAARQVVANHDRDAAECDARIAALGALVGEVTDG